MQESVRIDAILFETARPEELARFYAEAFGFEEPRSQGDDHVGVQAANTYLGFDRLIAAKHGGRGAVSVWFHVSDVEAAYRRLLELGASPKSPPDSECSPGETLATVLDPDENVIGLIGPAP